MLNLVLFGPPGAGKGTQSAKLVDTFNLVHLSTGDIFRYNIKHETELGKLAKSYIDKGELVPDEVTINMLKDELNKYPNAKGFIFDGFPRTVPQAQALDTLLAEKKTHICLMLSLDVPEDELTRRLLERGKVSGRSDDTDESIIRNRIRVYNEQTAVAAEFYDKQNKYKKIMGVGAIEDIFKRLADEVNKFLPASL
ncbi:MAG: adenylate kinase [Bacteroidetes bacterium]|nr:adenylate kinase [Bacteroidota bacterium]